MNTPTCAEAVKARMSNALLWLGVAATTLGLSAQAYACNARGEFCGRPTWAANAFSGPYNRVPEAAVETKHYQAPRPSRPERVEKVHKKVVPQVKFADGFGRQFDPASKVWFDGKSQCWFGKEQFTFKDGDWFYGAKEWAEFKGAWKVASGGSPELVSCESVPSFAAKATSIAAKAAAQKAENADKGATRQPAPVTPSPAKIKTAEGETAVTAQKPVTPAASAECKKYFPSIGQMLSVPCAE
jgi:hypothetical protein